MNNQTKIGIASTFSSAMFTLALMSAEPCQVVLHSESAGNPNCPSCLLISYDAPINDRCQDGNMTCKSAPGPLKKVGAVTKAYKCVDGQCDLDQLLSTKASEISYIEKVNEANPACDPS